MNKTTDGMDRITTDQIDRITPEERKALVGYCETHGWIKFEGEQRECECGAKFSNKHGLQITTQRTWKEKKK